VRFKSTDHYVTATNPDDSGETTYYATTPVAGLLFRPSANVRLHASFGEGFDTPTLDNLAYRPDGETGLNFGMQPARTGDGELGARWQIATGSSADVAVFRTMTRDELVVATSGGGRSTYQNAGRTRRQGLEAHWATHFASRWQWDFAYTYLDAVYRQAYPTCTSKSCVVPSTTIPAGNRLTGVPENQVSTALRWGADRGWNAAVEASYLSDIPVNDINKGAAPAYGLLGSNVGYVWLHGQWKLRMFVRVDNLLDTNYVGAIVVDDSNSQYYEPGQGRSVYGGVAVSFF
jgi:iron complex outermembrane receptor protein